MTPDACNLLNSESVPYTRERRLNATASVSGVSCTCGHDVPGDIAVRAHTS